VPGFVRRHAGKLAASAVITGSILYALWRGGLKLVPDGGDFGEVHAWAIVAYVPTWFAMTWFRSVRWRFLLRAIADVPTRRLFAISCVGLCAIVLLPFRLGELVRPYLLSTGPRESTRLTMTAATSSIVAERVIDGLVLSVALAIVLVTVPALDPLPDHVVDMPVSVAAVRDAGFALLGVFAIAFVVIGVFYTARGWADRATRVVVGKLSPQLAERLAGFVERLADGLHVFGRARDAAGFLVETIAYWAANALGMWLLAVGCGVVHADGTAITFAETIGLMGMLGCTVLIPGPPGLLGVFQVGVYAGMSMYFPASVVSGPGAAYVFLLYGLQLALHLVTASWGLWHEGGARRLRGM
jgi:uncharacterized protein (TIRG00374 family)